MAFRLVSCDDVLLYRKIRRKSTGVLASLFSLDCSIGWLEMGKNRGKVERPYRAKDFPFPQDTYEQKLFLYVALRSNHFLRRNVDISCRLVLCPPFSSCTTTIHDEYISVFSSLARTITSSFSREIVCRDV